METTHTENIDAPQTRTHPQHALRTELKRLDLSAVIDDKSSPIHSIVAAQFNRAEALMSLQVIDLHHVYISSEAKRAINDAYVTPLFVMEAFANYYCENLLRELTRGHEKGHSVLDVKASTFVHRLRQDSELIVRAETVDANGVYVRRLTITCRHEHADGGIDV